MNDQDKNSITFEYEELLEQLVANVKTFRIGVEEAAAKLIHLGMSEERIKASLEEYRRRAKLIKRYRKPASMFDSRYEDWYLGPIPGDKFWPAYSDILVNKGWGAARESIDSASTKVVSLLEPPYAASIKTRGLVLGYVQSGKTASYTGVIAKAADAGYRLFIVLTGMLETLRVQTLERMERELVSPSATDWVSLTTVHYDFKSNIHANVNAFLTAHGDQRILLVMKKNGPVLRNLIKWLKGAREEVLGQCPTLIIDDEADQASINTKKPEDQPAPINSLIRELRELLPRCAYVAYTATPFANVLIDPALDDLYPSDFIVDLPKPPEGLYFGPEAIFGRDPLELDNPEDAFDGMEMINTVPDSDVDLLKPASPKVAEDFWPALTPSLKDALNYFLMVTAARRVRGQEDVHSTMLVHTTLSVIVHDRTKKVIAAYMDSLDKLLEKRDRNTLMDLDSLWERETGRVPAAAFGLEPVIFEQLVEYLPAVMGEQTLVVENNQSTERLDYSGGRSVVIVVGGNVLSRGLTLEGLSVSFFIRAASTYDTLLQMGRWFGYRPGYVDLPRIWMTSELQRHFRDLATVEQEIRNDVRRYEYERLTPLQFAVRIRQHPTLMVTSRMKMRAAIERDVSYAYSRPQTIYFSHRDRAWLENNIEATKSLLRAVRNSAGEQTADPVNGRRLAWGRACETYS